MKKICVLIIMLAASTGLFAQDSVKKCAKEMGFGIGAGNAYASLLVIGEGFKSIGTNFEYLLLDYCGIFVAVGINESIQRALLRYGYGSNQYEADISGGVRIYLLSPDKPFRPKISISYGPNGYLGYNCFDINGMQHGSLIIRTKGISVGAGFKVSFGSDLNWAFDMDLIGALVQYPWIDISGLNARHLSDDKFRNKGGDTKISLSIGLRYEFDLFR